jgi:hypothetical protein
MLVSITTTKIPILATNGLRACCSKAALTGQCCPAVFFCCKMAAVPFEEISDYLRRGINLTKPEELVFLYARIT